MKVTGAETRPKGRLGSTKWSVVLFIHIQALFVGGGRVHEVLAITTRPIDIRFFLFLVLSIRHSKEIKSVIRNGCSSHL